MTEQYDLEEWLNKKRGNVYNPQISIESTPVSHVGELQDLVAYFARISNDKSRELGRGTDRLCQYLSDHGHWSPFEMVNVVLGIWDVPRDVTRQMLRHRSFTFQEYSGRYSEINEKPIKREARKQDTTNRQHSILFNREHGVHTEWEWMQREVWETCLRNYRKAIKLDIAKEVARTLIPEGLNASQMFVNGSLRSWMHYVEARTSMDTQREHRILACKIADALSPIFPFINDFTNGDGYEDYLDYLKEHDIEPTT